jgi:hypothetical protein
MRRSRQTKALARAALGVFWLCVKLSHAEAEPPLPEVTVEAQRTEFAERVNSYVRGITRNPGATDQESLARWNTPICLLARGLSAEDAGGLLSRLSEIISAAGAPLQHEPCKPNFIVVMTAEPERLLDGWYAREPHLFRDASRLEIRHFLDSPSNPIRVWRNINRGRVATTKSGHFAPSTLGADSSPLATTASLDFYSIFAIIDSRRLGRVSGEQLAAYLAMAGLSNADLAADLGGVPSILRLFAAAPPPDGLSRWDDAYLTALYHSNPASKSQRIDIAARMVKEVAH